ncbi:putative transcriptional regulator/DNA-binding XRE family transcriptional regulator [Nocardioides zeae]|uniref:Transcriptional regulator/DNA-binding XRE family transcriptional regulator n=1 Tax=Nocardioides zeae TaxID=1457234 RepID=A0ACC6IF72_9ACTN|nr:short-chain fatty acyl-CoA regulator family protein [Nocardioides zeae]MDR6176407.1 putative transcriptional regulator/DNA-binding XRE family transcriptional regulator [Nocardioides zeae]MDR6209420.1 putative transcriptional regulator/DNA-binding XRE family transcriptional regulator [Nocardioides zeae]
MERVYAGGRLRRMRLDRGMTQVDLAKLLAISPSYLNQIEHDTRPLTVSVLFRINEVFSIDPGFFAPRDTARALTELREALPGREGADPVPLSDLQDLAGQMPEVAEAVIDLYRRFREATEHLGALTDARSSVTTSSPHEVVRDYFYRHQNYVDELDQAAERSARAMGTRRGEVRRRLRDHLAETHRITVVVRPREEGAPTGEMHRYDAAGRVLSFSPHLRAGQQAFRLATELAFLEQSDVIEGLLDAEVWPSDEARHLARIGLANHFAGAFILPYGPFFRAAEKLRYDVELLADHFGVSYETIAHRLSTLQRPGMRGVPFIFVRVDRAGNISKRQSATGFHFSRSGGTCPLWNVYESFAAPGRVITQVAEMPDGQRYLWVARSLTRYRAGHGQPAKTFAVGLGCEVRHAGRLVYADGLDVEDARAVMPIGPGCRTCERPRCPQRAAPPIGIPLAVEDHRSTFAPYPLAGSGPARGAST